MDIQKVDLKSADIAAEKREQLKALFPEAFTEGAKIDFERLKLTLGEMIDPGKERFGMNWPGKADCFKIIQQPRIAALTPVRKESIDFDTTENLFIEGDNLEVLKLLQKSYFGKIKMIYIDPPYNTGNDFIYPDNYSESLDTYLRYTGQIDNEGRKYSTNTEADGRFHSKWMNMMYPRLFLARNLLGDDGVIFISIDDNEVSNLRKLCDEIFGEENFLAQFAWRTDGNFDNQAKIKRTHEYILMYVKNVQYFPHPPVIDPSVPNTSKLYREAIRNTIVKNGPKNPISDIELPCGFPADFDDGKIEARTDSWPHYHTEALIKNAKLVRLVVVRSGWSSKDLLLEFIRNNCQPVTDIRGQSSRFVISSSGAIEVIKERSEKQSHVISSLSGFGGPQKASAEIQELGVVFDDYPKPTGIIKYFAQMNEGNDFITVDFFAGSATTAHAFLDLNQQDQGKRKFILVQLPEPCHQESKAFKAGYKTIADIGKERIRRVIKKIKEEHEAKKDMFSGDKPDMDLGFKVFKLQPSNFKLWNGEVAKDKESIEKQIELFVEHINPKSSQEDILYELLLKSGLPLTTRIEKINLAKKSVFSLDNGAMLICLEKELTPEVIKAMAEQKPGRVVCLDEGFNGNDQLKTNAVQIMKSRNIAFRTV